MNKKKVTRIISPFALLIFPFLLAAISLILFKTDIITSRSQAYLGDGTCVNGNIDCTGKYLGEDCRWNTFPGTCQSATSEGDCYCQLTGPQQCVFRDQTNCTNDSYCEWTGAYCRTTLASCNYLGDSCAYALDCDFVDNVCTQVGYPLDQYRTDCENIPYHQCTIGFYKNCYYDVGYQACITACSLYNDDPVQCYQHIDRCYFDFASFDCITR